MRFKWYFYSKREVPFSCQCSYKNACPFRQKKCIPSKVQSLQVIGENKKDIQLPAHTVLPKEKTKKIIVNIILYLYFRGESCAEEHSLSYRLFWHIHHVNYLSYLRLKSHIQHSVSLIHYQVLNSLKRDP